MANINQTNSALVHIFFAIPDPGEHIDTESQEFTDYIKAGPHCQFLKHLFSVLQDADIGYFEIVKAVTGGDDNFGDLLLGEIVIQGANEWTLVAAINRALSMDDHGLLDVSVLPQSEVNWVIALHDVANVVPHEVLERLIDALPAEAKAKAEEDIRERLKINAYATPGDILVSAFRAYCDFKAGVFENPCSVDEPYKGIVDSVLTSFKGASHSNQASTTATGGF